MPVAPTPFETPDDLAAWFVQNAATATELWVHIHKVKTGTPSVTWDDCVIESLRVGWIDGIKKSLGPDGYLQRLTPRRAGSGWSKRNRDHCERLIAAGRMTPAGQVQVDAAKADGRWDAAYAGPADMVIPDWFLTELNNHPTAKAQFDTLNRTNLYTIYHRLHTAKTDKTRAARMAVILDTLTAGKRFH
jgi:uncharacterized protein YdeI (YjbR/CyaY-like superfamily)